MGRRKRRERKRDGKKESIYLFVRIEDEGIRTEGKREELCKCVWVCVNDGRNMEKEKKVHINYAFWVIVYSIWFKSKVNRGTLSHCSLRICDPLNLIQCTQTHKGHGAGLSLSVERKKKHNGTQWRDNNILHSDHSLFLSLMLLWLSPSLGSNPARRQLREVQCNPPSLSLSLSRTW